MIKRITVADIITMEIGEIDLFIAFCSFESRCLTATKKIPYKSIKKALVYMNSEASTEAEKNLKTFEEILGGKETVKRIPIFSPLDVADIMLKDLQEVCESKPKPELLVDITSFTHEALLIFIAIVKNYLKDAKIKYIYSNAYKYATESSDISERWLSRGIKEVRSVLGYAGDIRPSQETALIMMVGYECERAWQVIDAIAPEELIITYNDASGSTDQTNRGANRNYARLLQDFAAYYQNLKQYVIPSNDPFGAFQELEKIIHTIGADKNIIIAPMNNKLATVGAAIVALTYPKIQLCYAPAIYYNTDSYSIEGDTCYLFSLDGEYEPKEPLTSRATR